MKWMHSQSENYLALVHLSTSSHGSPAIVHCQRKFLFENVIFIHNSKFVCYLGAVNAFCLYTRRVVDKSIVVHYIGGIHSVEGAL